MLFLKFNKYYKHICKQIQKTIEFLGIKSFTLLI